MYAIIRTGGKQYRAAKDDVLVVEKLEGEVGGVIVLDDVLMVCDGEKVTVGSPLVKGAKVNATIVRHGKAKKIEGFNYKAKKNVRRRWGHRQQQTTVRVTEVVGGK